MEKIKNVRIGDRPEMVLKFQSIQIKKTNANEDYASLIGFDGEDLIEVKIWSLPEGKKEILKSGEIYFVSGVIKDYQGKKQFNVSDFRLASDDEVDKDSFYEYAPLSKTELQTKISSYINKIQNANLKNIVLTTLKKYANDYFEYPAAVSIHHNYICGLAYHVYSMLVLADVYLKQYTFLNKDLVYSGIILHDIGKVKELSGSKGVEYTKPGNLLGHITIGANIVSKVCESLGLGDNEEAVCLIHMILAHHGELEYGSPKEPLMAEAALLYYLDFTDSRFASLEKYYKSTNKGEYTDPIFAFDKKSFYIPNID
ncbi:MAG: HD domain-containing protein [Bacilli bacterium]|nr:HD domain-containing protein [Bacilli bacterium]